MHYPQELEDLRAESRAHDALLELARRTIAAWDAGEVAGIAEAIEALGAHVATWHPSYQG